MPDPTTDLITHLIALQQEERQSILCLVTATRGSTPQPVGALMAVLDDGRTLGTIGGGWLEAEVAKQGAAMLAAGTSGMLRFDLDRDDPADQSMACGGSVEIAVGPLPATAPTPPTPPAPRDGAHPTAVSLVVDTKEGPVRYDLRIPAVERLYVAGTGHVGLAVADLAARLGFVVTVFDDRDVPAGVSGDAKVTIGPVDEALRAAPIDASTSCVIAMRGLAHDERALESVIGRGARYVGLLGGRRKRERIAEQLAARGVSGEALNEINAPAGLPIGAVTVDEIALAIVAELVQVRRANEAPAVEGPTPVRHEEHA